MFSAMFANLSQGIANAMINGEPPPNPFDPDAEQPSGLVVTPLFHVTANNDLAQSITVSGGKLVHMYKWDPGEALRLIEAEKVTGAAGPDRSAYGRIESTTRPARGRTLPGQHGGIPRPVALE